MLKHQFHAARIGRAAQRGVVLLVALVVLVAISVAGIAMIRSVDSATLVAGNLAFQQAATHSADKGIEAAITMLRGKLLDGTLKDNDTSNGYIATLNATDNPAEGQGWQQFWQDSLAEGGAVEIGTEPDIFGNRIFYIVHRLCANTGPPGGHCVASPAITKATGNDEEGGSVKLAGAAQVYYRITVRVSGPRKTESYVQSHIAL
jgi:Tfp pilus assembly protein PilX